MDDVQVVVGGAVDEVGELAQGYDGQEEAVAGEGWEGIYLLGAGGAWSLGFGLAGALIFGEDGHAGQAPGYSNEK